MTPRLPSPALVVDANILVSAVLGRGGMVVKMVASARSLLTSARAEHEVRRRLSDPLLADPAHEEALDALFELVERTPEPDHAAFLPEAARALRDAPASANGSEADAHLLALAWATDSDLWTHDRDFAGTGWPAWSSRNLLTALAEPPDV